MGHTPGPWLVREPEDGELHEIYAENGGDLICYPVWTANQQANVPLIAAAPELLAALKDVCRFERFVQGMNPSVWPAVHAAIAKAEGRSE